MFVRYVCKLISLQCTDVATIYVYVATRSRPRHLYQMFALSYFRAIYLFRVILLVPYVCVF